MIVMPKEIYRLARDLIDARRLLSLEDALQTPFLNRYMPEDKFTFSSPALWNGTHKKKRRREKE